jgi:hypothetical protein
LAKQSFYILTSPHDLLVQLLYTLALQQRQEQKTILVGASHTYLSLVSILIAAVLHAAGFPRQHLTCH